MSSLFEHLYLPLRGRWHGAAVTEGVTNIYGGIFYGCFRHHFSDDYIVRHDVCGLCFRTGGADFAVLPARALLAGAEHGVPLLHRFVSAAKRRRARQVSHVPQGSPFSGCSQLTARANTFAVEVLPVPRVPQNRYACAMRPLVIWLRSVLITASCPTKSSNRAGR